jgi:hypothetical protein
MSLDTETQGDTTTIEHFGREWTVPTKRHHKHIRQTKTVLRLYGNLDADDVAEIFLSAEDYQALLDLDVEHDELDAFSSKIAKALGMGDRGNSTPSPASS